MSLTFASVPWFRLHRRKEVFRLGEEGATEGANARSGEGVSLKDPFCVESGRQGRFFSIFMPAAQIPEGVFRREQIQEKNHRHHNTRNRNQ